MYEDDEGADARRLLAPLAGEPTGPSRVDIRRAIADGRRRQRTRRVAGVGAVAAVAALVTAGVPVALGAAGGREQAPPVVPATGFPAPSPTGSPSPAGLPACEVSRLPLPGEPYQSLVTGGDPTGRFLLGRSYSWASAGESNIIAGTRTEAVIWDDGEPAVVEIPGSDGTLVDINSTGVAVGTSFQGDVGPQTGWVYRDGQLSALAGGGVDALSGLSINEQSVIAGAVPRPEPGDGEDRVVPAVWWSPAAEPVELSVPGPTWSVTALDVDADGTVVGSGHDLAERPDAPDYTFVWRPDGTRQRLPPPTVDGVTATGWRAGAIRDGLVTGQAQLPLESGTGFELVLIRYDLRAGEFSDPFEAAPFYPLAWSPQGWSVGSDPDGLWLAGPAGELVRMPDRLPGVGAAEPGSDFGPQIVSVSDDGRVVGGQLYSGRTIEGDGGFPMTVDDAAIWRCE